MPDPKHRIFILGASGFLGHAIYKELAPYFKTYGTYFSSVSRFESKTHFFDFDIEQDDITNFLKDIRPTVIISTIKGPFASQIIAHRHIFEYLKKRPEVVIIFLSSANVFDAYSKFPSYENDSRLSNSIYGHFKIKIEHQLQKLPERQWVILRLPMVFGLKSHRINEIKQLHQLNEPIELFPNLIMNVSSSDRLTQQLHYIINRKKYGIFHCGSTDLVQHEDFIKNIVCCLGIQSPKYKFVYTTNDARYLAVLPKYNKLPKYLQYKSQNVLDEIFKSH